MRIISSAEFRDNMKKYLDMAGSEKIVIQRGKNETFELTKKRYKEPDADFYRAVSLEQMRTWIHDDIDEMYKLPR